MNFREYRRREAIRAAEISESNGLRLQPADIAQVEALQFDKGDYVENREGILLGWKKDEFEAAFIPTRAPRTVKTAKKRKVAIATTLGT